VVMAILGGIAIDSLGHQVVIVAGIVFSAAAIFLVGQCGSIASVMGAKAALVSAGSFSRPTRSWTSGGPFTIVTPPPPMCGWASRSTAYGRSRRRRFAKR